MDATQSPNDSSSQKVGLPEPQHRRYLAVTLAVAKRLVKEAKEQSGREEKIRWRDVTLVMEAGAIAEVDAQLSKEGIDQVDKTAIRVRLKKAMRDVQRSSKTGSSDTATASSSKSNDPDRPYDPIRDI